MKLIYGTMCVFLLSISVSAQNWPQFRGPNASGWVEEQKLPDRWDVASGGSILWATPIPGVGHSSPIIWENRVFVTTAIGDEWNWHDDSVKHVWKLISLDKETGKILWEQVAAEGPPRTRRHEKSSQSNSTPVTDGKYVAAIMGSEGLFVYGLDGKLRWKKDLGLLNPGLANDPSSHWGYASSPIIYKDLLIVQCDRHKDSFLAAYHLSDGKEAWITQRPDELPSWSTPTIYEGKNRNEVITNGQFYRGYDLATGKEVWRFADAAEVKQPTPVIEKDTIYVTGGYPRGRPIFALKAGGTGDLSTKEANSHNPNVAWRTDKGGPYTVTPIVYRDLLYTVANNGVLTCYDAKSGEKKYETKLEGDFSASPVASNGKLYFASEDGIVSVVKAGPVFELIAKNDMDSPCYATPAISANTLFVRTLDQLYAISFKEKK